MPLNQQFDPAIPNHSQQSPYAEKYRTINRSSAALADKFRSMNLNVQDPHYSAGMKEILKNYNYRIKKDNIIFFQKTKKNGEC